MYNEKIEGLISAALADGMLTEKEKQILFKRAEAEGIDLDEFEMVLDARLVELEKSSKAAAAKSAPESDKFGNVRKCPACGAMLQSFQTTCSECGYEFKNVESIKSAKKLFDLLQAVDLRKSQELAALNTERGKVMSNMKSDDKTSTFGKFWGLDDRSKVNEGFSDSIEAVEDKAFQEKLNIIKSFPVPNSREDLLELLAMATSNAYDNDGRIGAEEEVWIQKSDQIYQKIIICAKNDRPLLEQGTQMVLSLMKRLNTLPDEFDDTRDKYVNFTQIPLEMRGWVKEQLAIEKKQKQEAKKEIMKSLAKSWKGILLIICRVVSPFIYLISLVPAYFLFQSLKEQYKEEVKNGLL